MSSGEDLAALAAAMVEAYVNSGKRNPMLPAGRREEIIALLHAVMTDPEVFDVYRAALVSEQERQGMRMLLLLYPGLDILEEQIAAEGFGGLSDEQLANIAISPEAIEAVMEHLVDAEVKCGPWFTEGSQNFERLLGIIERADAMSAAMEEFFRTLRERVAC